MYEAKNSKIRSFWTIWPVIQLINDHLKCTYGRPGTASILNHMSLNSMILSRATSLRAPSFGGVRT